MIRHQTFSRSMSTLIFAGVVAATFTNGLLAGDAQAATVTVGTTNETLGDGRCSLSEAVKAVNNHASFDGCTFSGTGADTVVVPAGTYQEAAMILITRSMTIQGPGIKNGTQQAIVSANVQDSQLFSIAEGSTTMQVIISGLELLNAGGTGSTGISAVGNYRGSILSVRGCWIFSFDTFGVNVSGVHVSIQDSLLQGNSLAAVAADARLTILNSAIVENPDDGVYFSGFGTSTIQNTTIAWNGASGLILGNLDEQPGDLMTISASTIAFNKSGAGVDAYALNYNVDSSIISDNSDGANELDWRGHIARLTNSAIKSTNGTVIGSNSHNLLNQDPLLLAGTNAGPFWIGGGYFTPVVPLAPGSPAIDFVSTGTGTDQRHFPRGIAGGTGRSTRFDIGAVEMDPHIQGETLVVIQALTGPHVPTTDSDSRYSNGQASKLPATSTNDFVTYQVPMLKDLTVTPAHVSLRVKKGPDAGIFQLFWSDITSAGTLHSLGTIDLYASTATFTTVTMPNTAALTTDGKFFKFKVTGKNSRSSGYNLYIDTIDLN